MGLHHLSYTKGSRGHKRKTYGRGFGSGIGKTGGKGTKGQKQRKSGHVRLGFEGGQTPIYRKVPKVGFNNHNFKNRYNVITLEQINELQLKKVNYQTLVEHKLIKDNKLPIKIIGNADLKSAVEVEVDYLSDGAKKKLAAIKSIVTIITK